MCIVLRSRIWWNNYPTCRESAAKSAQRLAFHILNMTEEQVAGLSGAMMSAKKNVHYCKECCTYTDGEICPICANPKRNHRQIMVVENTRDLAAYEKTGKFDGVYHVLHGAISPMAGVGPDVFVYPS